MTGEEATVAVIDALNELAIPYMLVGSFASNRYGIPRSTKDADFVVELGELSIAQVARKLAPSLRLEPQMSFETITGTTRHEFTLVGDPFKVELFQLGTDPYDQERFRRRLPARLLDRDVRILTAEDVVITKLRWARPKDRDDVRDVIAVQDQSERLDWDYIHIWVDRHGNRALLDEIRRSIPRI
jgi:hypothetical protein